MKRFKKAQLDLKFLLDCKKNEVYPKFVRWKNITRMKRKKAQARSLHVLLNITNRFAWICLTSGNMSNDFSLRFIYLSRKVLYFIVSDDDFEIINVENLQLQPASTFEAYLSF